MRARSNEKSDASCDNDDIGKKCWQKIPTGLTNENLSCCIKDTPIVESNRKLECKNYSKERYNDGFRWEEIRERFLTEEEEKNTSIADYFDENNEVDNSAGYGRVKPSEISPVGCFRIAEFSDSNGLVEIFLN